MLDYSECICFSYTYEVAPVFTLIEQVLLNHFCKLVGYASGDGTFSPGKKLIALSSTCKII